MHDHQLNQLTTILHRIEASLLNVERLLAVQISQGVLMSRQVDDLVDAVAAETTVEQSAVTLLTEIGQQLSDAGTDRTKLTALRATIESNKAALAAAVLANTPAAPPDTVSGSGGGTGGGTGV